MQIVLQEMWLKNPLCLDVSWSANFSVCTSALVINCAKQRLIQMSPLGLRLFLRELLTRLM